MPFPSNLEAMFAAGYVYSRAETCPVCGLEVEIYLTPGKREIAMEPMCGKHSPAVRHYQVCNIAPKQEEQSGRGQSTGTAGELEPTRPDSNRSVQVPVDSPDGHGGRSNTTPSVPSGLPVGRCDARSQIKLHGVTDPNHQIIAVGWDDGTLVVQFKTAKWSYANVPEDLFLKLRRVPFAYRQFNSTIKGKFTATKME